MDDGMDTASRLEPRRRREARFRGFEAEEFRKEDFDVFAFVRRFGKGAGGERPGEPALSALKADLSTHLSAIQGDLLALVHRDYADFVRLSTELEGVDDMLMECRRPVLKLRKNARQLREAAAHALEQLQSGATRNTQLQSEAAHLELSMRALRTLQLAERLVAGEKGGGRRFGGGGQGGSGDNVGSTFSDRSFEAYVSIFSSSADISDDSESETEEDYISHNITNASAEHGSEAQMDAHWDDHSDNVTGRSAEDAILKECATLERAARLLSHVRTLQADMRRSHTALVVAAKATGGLTAADLFRSLGQEYEHVNAFLNVRTRKLEEHLLSRLEVAYGSEIVPDILAGGGYRGSTNVNVDALSYCLRAYCCLGAHARREKEINEKESDQTSVDGNSRSDVGMAASVYARLVMRPFLGELLTLGNLDGGVSSSPVTSSNSGTSNRGSCDGLPSILAKLCEFVQTQCSVVLKVLRTVKSEMDYELMHASGAGVTTSNTKNSGTTSATVVTFAVDILSDGIWNPIALALEDKFGAQLFSFAQPDRFHRNFSSCKHFIEVDLPEAVDATPEEREKLRSHSATSHFWSRWSLPIYFGLRQKMLTGELEEAMPKLAASVGQEQIGLNEGEGPGYVAARCVERCWDRDTVFLDWLAPRFFQLSLELGAKYAAWFESRVNDFGEGTSVRGEVDVVRWGPPLHADMETLAAAFSSTLAEHAVAALSIDSTDAAVESGWQADAAGAIRAAYTECASRMRNFGIKIWDAYVEALVQQCTVFSQAATTEDQKSRNKRTTKSDSSNNATSAAAARAAVKAAGLEVKSLDSVATRVDGIARTFRFSSSRPLPKDPSEYVALLTLPLREAVVAERGMKMAPMMIVAKVVSSVLTKVARKFRKCLDAMVEGARKTEASLQRVKKMASSSARSGASSDLTKIITQVGIDVGRFIQDAEGVMAKSLEKGDFPNVPEELEDLRRWARGLKN